MNYRQTRLMAIANRAAAAKAAKTRAAPTLRPMEEPIGLEDQRFGNERQEWIDDGTYDRLHEQATEQRKRLGTSSILCLHCHAVEAPEGYFFCKPRCVEEFAFNWRKSQTVGEPVYEPPPREQEKSEADYPEDVIGEAAPALFTQMPPREDEPA